ncbi:MAG: SCO1664 family protein [Caldilineaceae bacterium]|nr:SCO1664 family protein [Caldilineaceae bacterium]
MSTPPDEKPVQIDERAVLEALQNGSIKEKGLLPYSSNYSFLVTVESDDLEVPAVYKPRKGENPLWDFTSGTLCQRETAAYVVSNALGWDLVPPTVLRRGKHGIGSVQFYIDHDTSEHYFTFQCDARYADALRKLALFDYVVNNADRKSGHCLAGSDMRIWAIDHGICFHTEYKLRTVIWEFSGQAIEPELLDDLDAFCDLLGTVNSPVVQKLTMLLDGAELYALADRVERLLQAQSYPAPLTYKRNYPWPPV